MKILKWISTVCLLAVICNVALAFNENRNGLSSDAQIKGIVSMSFIGIPAFILFLIRKMLGFGKKKQIPNDREV